MNIYDIFSDMWRPFSRSPIPCPLDRELLDPDPTLLIITIRTRILVAVACYDFFFSLGTVDWTFSLFSLYLSFGVLVVAFELKYFF